MLSKIDSGQFTIYVKGFLNDNLMDFVIIQDIIKWFYQFLIVITINSQINQWHDINIILYSTGFLNKQNLLCYLNCCKLVL